eukprot:3427504-Lingulodinium_polyedra.AAC.1
MKERNNTRLWGGGAQLAIGGPGRVRDEIRSIPLAGPPRELPATPDGEKVSGGSGPARLQIA